jgi:hypothetical protein
MSQSPFARELALKMLDAVELLHGKKLNLHVLVSRDGMMRAPLDVLAQWVEAEVIPTVLRECGPTGGG